MRQIATQGFITPREERTLQIATHGLIPFGGQQYVNATLAYVVRNSAVLEAEVKNTATLEVSLT